MAHLVYRGDEILRGYVRGLVMKSDPCSPGL